MMMFIKMSSGWYGTEFDLDNMREHVNNGNIVAVAEDAETFAMEMEIDEDEITMT
ncbi:hypothetical protein LCGC14_2456600 [marine sediment metagenome]|uniref:Uncharacterized protein n=1 Tax=marine sediment metagenome TaxID=412755 RepID=A0A0F9DRQ2_9ZZZZ